MACINEEKSFSSQTGGEGEDVECNLDSSFKSKDSRCSRSRDGASFDSRPKASDDDEDDGEPVDMAIVWGIVIASIVFTIIAVIILHFCTKKSTERSRKVGVIGG